VLIVEGTLVNDEYRGGLSIRVDRIGGLEEARLARAAGVELRLRETWLQQSGMTAIDAVGGLKTLLEPTRGGHCEVRLRYQRLDAEALLRLGVDWKIKPTDSFLRQAQRLLGAGALSFHFRPTAEGSASPSGT
jgi:DNA polymerase-3 subunit alpha